MSSKEMYDVIIVGSGLAGLSLACELVRQGTTKIAIIDKLSSQDLQTKGYISIPNNRVRITIKNIRIAL